MEGTGVSTSEIITWVVNGFSLMLIGLCGVVWKTLTDRVVTLEHKVDDTISKQLNTLNVSVAELSGKLDVTNTRLEALDTQLSERIKTSEQHTASSLAEALVIALSDPKLQSILHR